jgi:predicted anti-sigma-YlaC factor YlaD
MQTVNQHIQSKHLSDDQIDQYRAGLLEDTPEIREHLDNCDICRKRSQRWNQLNMDVHANLEGAFAAQRETVFKQARQKRFLTLPALAVAASLFVAIVGITTFTSLQQQNNVPQHQIAQENTEILNDIDFYIWLSHRQDDTAIDEGNT